MLRGAPLDERRELVEAQREAVLLCELREHLVDLPTALGRGGAPAWDPVVLQVSRRTKTLQRLS